MRSYGSSGPRVIVLHGGPAAAGEAAPIAVGLAGEFRVLEPWQRGSGDEPLTVARHVADLQEVVLSCGEAVRPALVGHSWGAMLALAYAAAHPTNAGPLVLVGCGTFDPASRARMQEILQERMDDDLRHRLNALDDEIADPAERFAARRRLMEPLYSYDRIDDALDSAADAPAGPFDVRAHEETWSDMLRLQGEGVYPAAFAAIDSPVLMLHGTYDPHPGRMISASLEPYLPQLEYRELEPCGHSPWLERSARAQFFAALRDWLQPRVT